MRNHWFGCGACVKSVPPSACCATPQCQLMPPPPPRPRPVGRPTPVCVPVTAPVVFRRDQQAGCPLCDPSEHAEEPGGVLPRERAGRARWCTCGLRHVLEVRSASESPHHTTPHHTKRCQTMPHHVTPRHAIWRHPLLRWFSPSGVHLTCP